MEREREREERDFDVKNKLLLVASHMLSDRD